MASFRLVVVDANIGATFVGTINSKVFAVLFIKLVYNALDIALLFFLLIMYT